MAPPSDDAPAAPAEESGFSPDESADDGGSAGDGVEDNKTKSTGPDPRPEDFD